MQTETLYLGDKKISIRTSVLEEKATACNMLCCYADELEVGFFPWVEQVLLHTSPAVRMPGKGGGGWGLGVSSSIQGPFPASPTKLQHFAWWEGARFLEMCLYMMLCQGSV